MPCRTALITSAAKLSPFRMSGGFALPDVRRVLLGISIEVRAHDAERRQGAVSCVREELVDAADMLHIPADSEREDVGRELYVLLDALAHGGNRTAQRHDTAPGHLALVPGIVLPSGLFATGW